MTSVSTILSKQLAIKKLLAFLQYAICINNTCNIKKLLVFSQYAIRINNTCNQEITGIFTICHLYQQYLQLRNYWYSYSMPSVSTILAIKKLLVFLQYAICINNTCNQEITGILTVCHLYQQY